MKIAVVGLGIAGLSACVRLAQAGHDVDGFEQFELMHENGSSHGDTRIIRLTPGEGEIYVSLAERAHALWRDWEKRAGVPLLHWTGGLMAGPPGSNFVASCTQLSEAHGHSYSLTRGGEIEALMRGAVRLPADWSVCLQEDCGVVYADAARAFLIRYAQDLGARLNANVSIAAPIDGASLTINGEVRAFDAIIVTAGPWTGKLAPEMRDLLNVRRRVMGWFAPRAPLAAPPPVLCVDNDVGVFGMPIPDGRYKIGFHSVGEIVDPDHVRAPDVEDAALLSAHAAQFLPLHDPKPVALTRCLYTLTADENFLAAPSRANAVFILSCCSGHGFKYAPLYGQFALDWIEGRATPELAAFGRDGRTGAATKLGGA